MFSRGGKIREFKNLLIIINFIIAQHIYGEMGRRSYQNVVIGLRREFRYGVTTADEGLRPISPSKLKYPPHPSGRRYQTNQETLFSLVMFI